MPPEPGQVRRSPVPLRGVGPHAGPAGQAGLRGGHRRLRRPGRPQHRRQGGKAQRLPEDAGVGPLQVMGQIFFFVFVLSKFGVGGGGSCMRLKMPQFSLKNRRLCRMKC